MFKLINVSKKYPQAKGLALKPTDLSIEKGEIFGIVGQSGAGKSTLLRCLATLTKPSSGKILFHGRDLAQMDHQQLRSFRQNMGMIFQQFNLFTSRTAFENVAFPLEIGSVPKDKQTARIEELLALVGLLEKKDAYPSQLSGGEKQRVAIARALANNPEVLFCDEATSALDPKTTNDILELLRKVNQTLGVTIILITHDMSVVERICTRVKEVNYV